MKISIVIPTYNREDDLNNCISSIINQELKPDEIIIVDDSSDDRIKKYVDKSTLKLNDNGIYIHYIRNHIGKSLTIARNLGIKNSKGDIIFFFDDDSILGSRYILETIKQYSSNPEIVGTQGIIKNYPKTNFFVEQLNKVFLLNHTEKNRCRVLPSSRCTYPELSTDKPISCEWLSGCNHSYKKEIFNEFRYDEKMTRYSFREDLDMSYRIHKKYPKGLILIPQAECIHNESEGGRILKKEQTYMEIGYTKYFFYKNIEQNIKNRFLLSWSNFGLFIKNIGEVLVKSNSGRLSQINFLIRSHLDVVKYIHKLKKGELSDFNKSIFE